MTTQRANNRSLREVRNEAAKGLNFYAATFGKGPTFALEPSPARSPRTKPQPGPESSILAAVFKFLSIHPSVGWVRRMNTGAMEIGSGASRRFVRFGFPGCSDILGQMRDGRLLAIEVKAATGRVSEHQERFLRAVANFGGVSGVARTLEDVEQILRAAQGMCASATVLLGQGHRESRAGMSGPAHALASPHPDTSPDTTCR